jgi:Tfp pilus assembly PilM family ATPase
VARFLAIDWDQSSLHVIAANVGGGSAKVQSAAVWQMDEPLTSANAAALGQVLRDRLKEAGIRAAPVLFCVPRERVTLKELRVPPVSEAEEAALVRFQAVKELAESPDDVVIDYSPEAGQGPGEGPENAPRRVLAMAVRRELLSTYQAVCTAAGLKLECLTARSLGLMACLTRVMGTSVLTPTPEPPDSTVAGVLLGERGAELCVFRGAVLLQSRSLAGNGGLAQELRRGIALYDGTSPQRPVRAVYVAGKGTGEVRQGLVDLIEVPVHSFDPFAGSEVPSLPSGSHGAFAAAAGLLYGQARLGRQCINFVSPREPRATGPDRHRTARLACAAVLGLLIAIGLVFRVLQSSAAQDLAAANDAIAATDKQLAQAKQTRSHVVPLGDWASVNWLDELYVITYVNPNVDHLRVTSFQTEPVVARAVAKPGAKKEVKGPAYAARVTLRGKLLDKRSPRAPLDKLIRQLNRAYYTPEEPVIDYDKSEFVLHINVKKRGPEQYNEVLPPLDRDKKK